MQTTLLGLGIAIILVLLAALVGPYFVNWNDQRAFFEAEASRLSGLNVRVNGDIKVGILPVPKVNLDGIEIRPAGDANRLRARSLSVELGLGPLMRGEIRATEMRLVGPEFSIGLNSAGEVDWPAVTLPSKSLAIDRLSIEDGRIMLTDAASGSRLSLDKLWLVGDMRSLAGPFRGDGAFVVDGGRYSYRFNASRYGPEGYPNPAWHRYSRKATRGRGRRPARLRTWATEIRWRLHAVARGRPGARGRQKRTERALAAGRQGQCGRATRAVRAGCISIWPRRTRSAAWRHRRTEIRRPTASAGRAFGPATRSRSFDGNARDAAPSAPRRAPGVGRSGRCCRAPAVSGEPCRQCRCCGAWRPDRSGLWKRRPLHRHRVAVAEA